MVGIRVLNQMNCNENRIKYGSLFLYFLPDKENYASMISGSVTRTGRKPLFFHQAEQIKEDQEMKLDFNISHMYVKRMFFTKNKDNEGKIFLLLLGETFQKYPRGSHVIVSQKKQNGVLCLFKD